MAGQDRHALCPQTYNPVVIPFQYGQWQSRKSPGEMQMRARSINHLARLAKILVIYEAKWWENKWAFIILFFIFSMINHLKIDHAENEVNILYNAQKANEYPLNFLPLSKPMWSQAILTGVVWNRGSNNYPYSMNEEKTRLNSQAFRVRRDPRI